MKVFISWSGERSRLVAEALRDWLPKIIQEVDPFVSAKDLTKGAPWPGVIAENLAQARLGIICLTTDNLESPWLLFEAGALSRPVNQEANVCTYLLDLEPELLAPPLSLFQATRAIETDTRALLDTINSKVDRKPIPQSNLDSLFEFFWPKLQASLTAVPSSEAPTPSRTDGEKLDEILQLVRGLGRSRSNLRGLFSNPMPLPSSYIGVVPSILGGDVTGLSLAPTRMLVEWSPEYVDAFFRSDMARHSLQAVFPNPAALDLFVHSIQGGAFSTVSVRRLENGCNALIEDVTSDNLLELVKRARALQGEVLFPGALPRIDPLAHG